MLAGLAVFALTYALLAVPALPRLVRRLAGSAPSARVKAITDWLLGRPGLALGGALLMLAVGAVGPAQAARAVDLRTLALLAGMMLLVSALEAANTFGWLAGWLARRLPTPRRMLVGTMVAVALLSALVLNDAVVLLFTPVLVRAARAMDAPAFPLLCGAALAANVGSAATPVGNPQNAAIALARDVPFLAFVQQVGPLALAALLIAVVAVLVAFRRDLAPPRAAAPPAAREPLTRPRMLAVGLLGVALALAGFLVGPAFGIPLWASALAAGLVVLALSPLGGVPPARVARQVDVGILVFFVGLFVLLEGIRESAVVAALTEATGGTGRFVALTAVLSNLVSNVPAVLLLLPLVGSQEEALLLAAASTFAGNATFLGSAATVIVAETARAFGADFRVGRFTLVGLPVAGATLALTWLALG